MNNKQDSNAIRRHAFDNYVFVARKSGKREFDIVVGDIHRDLRMQNRVPQVCAALRSKKFLVENHLVLVGEAGPPSGMSTTVKLTYRFQDDISAGAPAFVAEAIPDQGNSIFQRIRGLYGIAAELCRSIGGGENALREDRERFYGTDSSERMPR